LNGFLALQKPDPKIIQKMTIQIPDGPVFGPLLYSVWQEVKDLTGLWLKFTLTVFQLKLGL
jgi:hypothetical protein